MPGCCEARSASARNSTKACRKHERIRGWSLSETSIIRGWECFLQIFCISRRLRLQLLIACYVILSDPAPLHFQQLAETLRHPFRIPTSNSQVVTNRDQKSMSTFSIFTRNAAASSRILLTIMLGFGAFSQSHRPVDGLQFEPSVPAERTGSISKSRGGRGWLPGHRDAASPMGKAHAWIIPSPMPLFLGSACRTWDRAFSGV
jgi:hypothetical protein